MNITGIEQGQGSLGQLANTLSSASKPTTAVQRPEDEKESAKSALQAGGSQEQGIKVEISRAAQALAQSELSSQQGTQQDTSSLLDRE
ncbi:MAG: hypothetical protein NPIRA04_31510 [Nitrospirales bacterium]|nr:MAG: hypothetical protein NPIRA04_31510 [Nitrospirales bacterium]